MLHESTYVRSLQESKSQRQRAGWWCQGLWEGDGELPFNGVRLKRGKNSVDNVNVLKYYRTGHVKTIEMGNFTLLAFCHKIFSLKKKIPLPSLVLKQCLRAHFSPGPGTGPGECGGRA